MDDPILPFELILEIANHLDTATLNALIRTHKRAAAALTTRLYDIGLSTSQETEQDFEDEYGRVPKLEAVFGDRVFKCIPRWSSELLIEDLLSRLKYHSLCGVTRCDPPDALHGSPYPFTFMQVVATAGNVPVIRALIESGAPVDTRDVAHWTALHTAVHHNHEELAMYLLSAGADILALDDGGFSLASNAAFDGSASLVKRVVNGIREAQGEKFEPPRRLATPLRLATLSENEDALRVFIDSGADPLVTGRVDEFALCSAIMRGYNRMAKLLIDATLETGGDINRKLHNGSTALHLAIQYERQNVARYLIECGADISAVDDLGRTPLHMAISPPKMPAIIKLLIEYGADPTIEDTDGISPFSVVDHFEVIQYGTLFLQAKPKLWADEHINMRLWKTAARCTHIEIGFLRIFKLLISTNLSPFEKLDEYGNTGLHLICSVPIAEYTLPFIDMVRILIDAGAEVAPRNNTAHTPFHYAVCAPAAVKTRTDLVRFLLSYEGIHGCGPEGLDIDQAIKVLVNACRGVGVDALAVDRFGTTPIDRAVGEIRDNLVASRARRLLGW